MIERVARPEGFEPPTFWFVARRSIQLSYERTGSKTILGAGRNLVNAPASVGSGTFWKWEAHAEPRGTCHGAFVPLVHPAAGAAGLSGKINIVKLTHYRECALAVSFAARSPTHCYREGRAHSQSSGRLPVLEQAGGRAERCGSLSGRLAATSGSSDFGGRRAQGAEEEWRLALCGTSSLGGVGGATPALVLGLLVGFSPWLRQARRKLHR